MSNRYKIEQKISTLADCAVGKKGKYPAFKLDGIEFSHWDFNYKDSWQKDDAWLAKAEIKAKNFKEAYLKFTKKLNHIIPRISLISQSYIEYFSESFLIHKIGSDIAFFRHTKSRRPTGLMFLEKHLEALEILTKETGIPESFYLYWKDAVNTMGYSSKLLLMFSAVEALANKKGKKDWVLIEKILGKKLKEKIYGRKNENNKEALRNRLVHGEYFNKEDDPKKDYVLLVHNKIIKYFNNEIFKGEELIDEKVLNPQRHLYGNKLEWKDFIKKTNGKSDFFLIDLLKYEKSFSYVKDLKNLEKY